MTFSFENFTTENGENGYFMNIHLCFLALNTLGTVLPDPQDEIISWVFNRRGATRSRLYRHACSPGCCDRFWFIVP